MTLHIFQTDDDGTYMLLDIQEHAGHVVSKTVLESSKLDDILKFIDEDAVPSNSVGAGNVAGITGEPAIPSRKKRVLTNLLKRKPQC